MANIKCKLSAEKIGKIANERGLRAAAREAGISPSRASRVLKDAGFSKRIVWVAPPSN